MDNIQKFIKEKLASNGPYFATQQDAESIPQFGRDIQIDERKIRCNIRDVEYCERPVICFQIPCNTTKPCNK